MDEYVSAFSGPQIDKAVDKTLNGTSYAVESMLAALWDGKTYSFEGKYPFAQYDITVEVAPTATAEQFEAFGAAMICGSADRNIATALGDVPTVDIPIIVKAVRK